MKLFKYIIAVVIIASAFTATTSEAKRKMVPQIYMFGFSAAFTDSVVYFTDVQKVDSVWIDTKSKFLLGRENYSYQLKEYFSHKQNLPNRTCVTMFGKTKKEAEDKYIKMKRKYTVKTNGMYDVRYISSADFSFKPIDMSYEEEEMTPARR